MGFKTAEPATRAPTVIKTATRAPSARPLATLAPSQPTFVITPAIGSGEAVEIPNYLTCVASESMTMEAGLQRAAEALQEPVLQSEAAMTVQFLQGGNVILPLAMTVEQSVASSFTTVTGTAPGIGVTEVAAGRAVSTTTVCNTSVSVAPTAGHLVVLALGLQGIGGAGFTITTVTGAGMTWVRLQQSEPSNGGAVSLWRSQSSTPGSGVLSVSVRATNHPIAWSLMSFSNVSTAGTDGSGAIIQSTNSAQSGGSSFVSGISMAPAAATRNLMVGAVCVEITSAETVSADTVGFTQVSFVRSTGAGRPLQTMWGASTSTHVCWRWDGDSTAAGVALEVG